MGFRKPVHVGLYLLCAMKNTVKQDFVNLHGVCDIGFEIIETDVSNSDIFSRNYLLQSDTRCSLVTLSKNRANGTAKTFALGSFDDW